MGMISNRNCVRGGQGSPRGRSRRWAGEDAREFDEPPRCRFGSAPEWLFWIAFLAVLAVFGMDGVRLHAESAKSFFKRGQAAEAREDYDAAFDDYQKAYSMAPSDLAYRRRSTGCGFRLRRCTP